MRFYKSKTVLNNGALSRRTHRYLLREEPPQRRQLNLIPYQTSLLQPQRNTTPHSDPTIQNKPTEIRTPSRVLKRTRPTADLQALR